MHGEIIFSSILYLFLFSIFFQFLLRVKHIYVKIYFFIIFLVFFIGYFIKSLLYFSEFKSVGALSNLTPEYIDFNLDLFLHANYISLLLLSFITAFLICYSLSSFNRKDFVRKKKCHRFWLSDSLFYSLFFLFVAIKTLQFKLGLGIMGSDNVVLPFHLHSFIFRIQGFVLIPLMLNSLLYKYSNFKMLLFVICLLSGIFFGSKSGLFFVLLYLAAILYIHNFLKLKFIFYSVFSIPFLLFFYWLGNSFRNLDAIASFDWVEISKSFLSASDIWTYIFKSSLNRFIGLDGIMYYLKFGDNIGFEQWLKFKLYFTYDVVGVQNPNDFRSPGFFSFLLFSTPGFSLILFPFLLIFLLSIFLYIVKNYFNQFIGYKLFILYSLYGVFLEGYLQYEDIFSLLLSIFLVKIVDLFLNRKAFLGITAFDSR